MATVLKFAGDPETTLSILLFKDVTNGGELQKQIVSGAIPVDCAFINASLVLDPFLLQLAAHAAIDAQQRSKLTTRSVYAEILFNLSGIRHISEALKRYGIHEGVSSVLAARFDATPEELEKVRAAVDGTEVPVEQLPQMTNTQLLQKMHKVVPQELEVGSLTDAIACRMAARDA